MHIRRVEVGLGLGLRFSPSPLTSRLPDDFLAPLYHIGLAFRLGSTLACQRFLPIWVWETFLFSNSKRSKRHLSSLIQMVQVATSSHAFAAAAAWWTALGGDILHFIV